MTKRPNLSLRQQVRELVAVNDSFADKLGECAKQLTEYEDRIELLTAQNAGLIAERGELEQNVSFWRRGYERLLGADNTLKDAAKVREVERTNALATVREKEEALDRLSRALEEARLHARVMRDKAYPARPAFPWEDAPAFAEVGYPPF